MQDNKKFTLLVVATLKAFWNEQIRVQDNISKKMISLPRVTQTNDEYGEL